jgi:hypothetical protein
LYPNLPFFSKYFWIISAVVSMLPFSLKHKTVERLVGLRFNPRLQIFAHKHLEIAYGSISTSSFPQEDIHKATLWLAGLDFSEFFVTATPAPH